MRKMFLVVLLLCLSGIVGTFALSAADPTPLACAWAQVTNVVDGETVDVLIDSTTHRVRYIGMDQGTR